MLTATAMASHSFAIKLAERQEKTNCLVTSPKAQWILVKREPNNLGGLDFLPMYGIPHETTVPGVIRIGQGHTLGDGVTTDELW